MKKFYQLTQNNDVAELYIYGDITSFKFFEDDVTAKNIIDEIKAITASTINVYISSYGGEVQAGLAIYNALKRHSAKVRTICDGFACSIASVIFMAGEERIMNDSSLLMIHNAWSYCEGNAKELRKQADDLEKITQASIAAYKAHSTLSEEEIAEMMDNESWILPDEALAYGFATAIEKTKQENASQNARRSLMKLVKMAQDNDSGEEEDETDEDEEVSPEDENPVEAEETPDDEPEDDEPNKGEETEEDSEDEAEDENEDEDEEPVQKMNGFFNAFLNFERRMNNEH